MGTRANPRHADCHHVGNVLENRTALATALFTYLGTCPRGLSATLPAFLARRDLTSASMPTHTPFTTVHSRLSRVVIQQRDGHATVF